MILQSPSFDLSALRCILAQINNQLIREFDKIPNKSMQDYDNLINKFFPKTRLTDLISITIITTDLRCMDALLLSHHLTSHLGNDECTYQCYIGTLTNWIKVIEVVDSYSFPSNNLKELCEKMKIAIHNLIPNAFNKLR